MRKLLIWGIGELAKRFIYNGFKGEIIGFIETTKSINIFMNKPVYGSEELPKEYDYIIVANSYTTEIYQLCLKLDIDITKVIFLYGVKNRVGCIESSILREILLEKNYTFYCAEFRLTDKTFVEKDKYTYQTLNQRSTFNIQDKYMWPVLSDKYSCAGIKKIRGYNGEICIYFV